MDLIEEGLHRLLGIPCLVNVLKVLLKVYRSDATIVEKYMIKHTLHIYVSKTDHVIV